MVSEESGGVSASEVGVALVDCGFLLRVPKALLGAGAELSNTNVLGNNGLHVAHPRYTRIPPAVCELLK